MAEVWDKFGEGSGWDTSNFFHFQSIVIVKRASQLAGELDSNTLYYIDGIVDMGTTQITVPSTGLNIKGLNPRVCKLISTEDSYTMFIGDATAGAGGFVADSVGFEVSGTNSQVFNLDNTNDGGTDEFSCTTVDFNNCTSLGYVAGYRQGLWEVVGLVNCDDGIELDRDWDGGFRATTSIVIGFGSSGTVFKAGSTLVFNNRFLTDMNFVGIPSGSTAIDFEPANFANDNTFIIRDAIFTGDGSFVPNTPPGDNVANFTNNIGITNTYVGATWTLTTQAATVITAISVPVKIAGTTTYSDLQHFTNTGNNAFTYNNTQEVNVRLTANLSFTGTNGDTLNVYVRQWDDSASQYIDITESGGATMNASGRAENVFTFGIATVNINDRLELWVKNESGARNATLTLNSFVTISER